MPELAAVADTTGPEIMVPRVEPLAEAEPRELARQAAAPERRPGEFSLAQLSPGEGAVLARLELADGVADRLMELGFVPGTELRVAHAAPGGDPCVYRVDGAEIALRNVTANCLIVSCCTALEPAR